jgi:hypothetical protein
MNSESGSSPYISSNGWHLRQWFVYAEPLVNTISILDSWQLIGIQQPLNPMLCCTLSPNHDYQWRYLDPALIAFSMVSDKP